ncbi:4-galactosyl-N-acetylglucosaminide 3-alpha-L-fucosyltransferase 9-like [Protopterus annectens]|uniref:4-galactosyl-N-acetylglucosaminide 3-alpha-L-fucosyltransferase 9-like n=1 Tax=Protopterus annectens TaxID=7888 RepID=UPI001CFA0B92|nr:4-galactosyl-N-acetylglucosaminide 3-alpha-L-fucosyltransferase 9-like [Protopterus annectens]
MKLTYKSVAVIIFFQFILAVCIFINAKWNQSNAIKYSNKYLNHSRPTEHAISAKIQHDNKSVTILLWNWPYGYHFETDKCDAWFNIPGCHFTDDKNLYSQADAVIIFHRGAHYSRKYLPQGERPLHQWWIWFNSESPSHSPNLELMNNLFNLTMTYRSDSDIFVPYGVLEMTKEPNNYSIPKKDKLVAWAVSNWNPNSRRVQYYQELKKYINIDVYGKSHQLLDRKMLHATLSQYKFYLTFENSVHTDYITEKLWRNAFISGAVPIVLGPPRENYEKFIPPGSFIHIEDFDTVEQMAKYLIELDRDEKKYRKYFVWRQQFVSKPATYVTHYCKACKAIKEATDYKTVTNLASWFRS